MDSEYIAHISEDKSREETVTQHLSEVAQLAREFAQSFGSGQEAYRIGMCHDAGKYSQEFQKRIRGQSVSVDHATSGAQILFPSDPLGALAIAGHHGGMPDLGNRSDTAEGLTLFGRCKRSLPDYQAFFSENEVPDAEYPDFLQNSNGFVRSFYARMLFSCLVDADYLCTERFMDGHPEERSGYNNFPELLKRFDSYAAANWSKSDTPLNRERLKIRNYCTSKASHDPGLFHLTIPTGGGKTAASMAFALHHVCIHKKQRIIYVIPYTSIIEQNSDVFEKALGSESVLQHHSNVDFPTEDRETLEAKRKRLAIENWDAPIVMTTAVQFFESLFSAKPSKCRKLHNIANSVIIFDEAQMMPLKYLRPCIAAVSELIAHYNVSAVMCTATQPALDDLFREYLPEKSAVELCPDDLDYDVFRRVAYSLEKEISPEAVVAKIQEKKQVLCIVNTRARAEDWFRQMPEEGTFHLSTRMTPNHRKQKLAQIKDRLNKNEMCRVISTSLIEAGVDVDFPVVYREIAGMDSIVQAAGRCNREGKLQLGSVHIFRTGEAQPKLQEFNISMGERLLFGGIMPDHPKAIQKYFRGLQRKAGKEGMDSEHILKYLMEKMALRTVSETFHIISEETFVVYIPNPSNKEALSELRNGKRNRNLMRHLGQDAVNLYTGQYLLLKERGVLEELEPGIAILINPEKNYSMDTGILVDAAGGDALFG